MSAFEEGVFTVYPCLCISCIQLFSLSPSNQSGKLLYPPCNLLFKILNAKHVQISSLRTILLRFLLWLYCVFFIVVHCITVLRYLSCVCGVFFFCPGCFKSILFRIIKLPEPEPIRIYVAVTSFFQEKWCDGKISPRIQPNSSHYSIC